MKITKQHLNKNKFSQIKVLLFVVASFLILGVKIYLEIVNKLKKNKICIFKIIIIWVLISYTTAIKDSLYQNA